MDSKDRNTKKELIRFIKFTLFSASAGGIETGLFYLLGLIFSNYWVCYLPALIASVVWNFTLNRRFTFKSAANVPVAMMKVFAYYAVFTPLSTHPGELAGGGAFCGVPPPPKISSISRRCWPISSRSFYSSGFLCLGVRSTTGRISRCLPPRTNKRIREDGSSPSGIR